MFRCSPRPGTAEERCLKLDNYTLSSAVCFHSLHAIQEHRHESFHQCSGSRCSPLQHINPGHLQVRRKQSLRQALHQILGRCQIGIVFATSSRFSTRRNSAPRVMSSPASNAACSIAAYFRLPALLCWCSGLYGRVSVSGAPAHMTCFLAKSVQSFHGF